MTFEGHAMIYILNLKCNTDENRIVRCYCYMVIKNSSFGVLQYLGPQASRIKTDHLNVIASYMSQLKYYAIIVFMSPD